MRVVLSSETVVALEPCTGSLHCQAPPPSPLKSGTVPGVMSDTEHLPTLATVVGQNLRALRGANGRSQADVAARARDNGLDWDRATVSAIESGRRGVGLHDVPLVPLALN